MAVEAVVDFANEIAVADGQALHFRRKIGSEFLSRETKET